MDITVKRPRLRINLNPNAVFYGWVEYHYSILDQEAIAHGVMKPAEFLENCDIMAENIARPILWGYDDDDIKKWRSRKK